MESNEALVRMTRPDRSEQSLAPLIRRAACSARRRARARGADAYSRTRLAGAWFLTSGYELDLRKLVNGALFAVKYDEMVVVKDIEFFSLCEHHMLPFFGRIHVAYLPDSKVIGLSKIPRIVNALARRLQIQERLTQEVAEAMQQIVESSWRGRDL